jgi:hypothetical protein
MLTAHEIRSQNDDARELTTLDPGVLRSEVAAAISARAPGSPARRSPFWSSIAPGATK